MSRLRALGQVARSFRSLNFLPGRELSALADQRILLAEEGDLFALLCNMPGICPPRSRVTAKFDLGTTSPR